jgi:Ca2+/Na+ antiporter
LEKIRDSAVEGVIALLVMGVFFLLLSIPIWQAVMLSFLSSFLLFVCFFIVFLVHELDQIEIAEKEAEEEAQAKEIYERDNPTVAMYRQLCPDEYIEVFDQNPEAFVNFCPFCGSPIRVRHKWTTEQYNSLTGKPESQSMKISCSGCGQFKHTVKRIFEDGGKDGNQIKRLQGEDLEVVEAEDEDNSGQLPPKLVSID